MTTPNIRAQINDLEVGQAVDFPLSRYDYVVSCRTRLQLGSTKQFSSKIDNEKAAVTITREDDKPQ